MYVHDQFSSFELNALNTPSVFFIAYESINPIFMTLLSVVSCILNLEAGLSWENSKFVL